MLFGTVAELWGPTKEMLLQSYFGLLFRNRTCIYLIGYTDNVFIYYFMIKKKDNLKFISQTAVHVCAVYMSLNCGPSR